MRTEKMIAVVYEDDSWIELIGCADNWIEAYGMALSYIRKDLHQCDRDSTTIEFGTTENEDPVIDYTSGEDDGFPAEIYFLSTYEFKGVKDVRAIDD